MMLTTDLNTPFNKDGIPTDYWLLLSLIRNGEVYRRKELIEMTTLAAVKKLVEEGLLVNLRGSGRYVISAEGLAFFETYKPMGALKRIPRTANMWKTTLYKTDGTIDTIKFKTMRNAKQAAKNLLPFDEVRRVQIDPIGW